MYIYICVYTTFTYIFSNHHLALLPRWDDGPESPMYYQDVPTHRRCCHRSRWIWVPLFRPASKYAIPRQSAHGSNCSDDLGRSTDSARGQTSHVGLRSVLGQMNHGYVNPRGHGLDRHMRLLLCMHDIELRLSKPGTCQWKFKDMCPSQYCTISYGWWQERKVTGGGLQSKPLSCSLWVFYGFLQVDFQAGPARDLACFTGSMSPGFLVLAQSCQQFRNVNPSGRGHRRGHRYGHRHGHRHGHRRGHRRGPQFDSQRGSRRWIWRWRTLVDVARCCIALTGRWTEIKQE